MSASISLHPDQREGEEEREGQRKSQRLRLFRKAENVRREKRKIENQTYVAACFPSLGEGVTVDLGLSLLNRLGHNSECMDMCGCLFAILALRHHCKGIRWGISGPGALNISHLVSEAWTAKDTAAMQQLMQRLHRTCWWKFMAATPSGTAHWSELLIIARVYGILP